MIQLTKQELIREFEREHSHLYLLLGGIMSFNEVQDQIYWFFSTNSRTYDDTPEVRLRLIQKEQELVREHIKPILAKYEYELGEPVLSSSNTYVNIPVNPVNSWDAWVSS